MVVLNSNEKLFIDKITRWNGWLAANLLLGESKYFISFLKCFFLPFV